MKSMFTIFIILTGLTNTFAAERSSPESKMATFIGKSAELVKDYNVLRLNIDMPPENIQDSWNYETRKKIAKQSFLILDCENKGQVHQFLSGDALSAMSAKSRSFYSWTALPGIEEGGYWYYSNKTYQVKSPDAASVSNKAYCKMLQNFARLMVGTGRKMNLTVLNNYEIVNFSITEN